MKTMFHFHAAIGVFLAIALAGLPVMAQQVTGVPGSPGATTTISGKQLPIAGSAFRRCDQGEGNRVQTVVAADDCSAEGRAQRAAHHDR
jgi:hypothetical protein